MRNEVTHPFSPTGRFLNHKKPEKQIDVQLTPQEIEAASFAIHTAIKENQNTTVVLKRRPLLSEILVKLAVAQEKCFL